MSISARAVEAVDQYLINRIVRETMDRKRGDHTGKWKGRAEEGVVSVAMERAPTVCPVRDIVSVCMNATQTHNVLYSTAVLTVCDSDDDLTEIDDYKQTHLNLRLEVSRC